VEDGEEDFIVRSFMTCPLHQILVEWWKQVWW